MVESFQDRNGLSLHDEFQAWRKRHRRGFFLSFRKKSKALIHTSECDHFGNFEWSVDEIPTWGSLATSRKVCSANQAELLFWADQEGLTYRPCLDCIKKPLVNGRRKIIEYRDYEPLDTAGQLPESSSFPEGGRRTIVINAYERNTAARRACLIHHGVVCAVCAFDFAHTYGNLGEGFIHVHHVVPLSQIKDSYKVDPVLDLVPVCPNCHEMLHHSSPALLVTELAVLMQRAKNLEPARK